MRGEARAQRGPACAEPIEIAARHEPSGFVRLGFEQIDGAVAIEVTVEESDGLCSWIVPRAVHAPVARHDVEASVAIEISRRDAVPPAGAFVQAERGGGLPQLALVVLINANRPPLAGENQFRKSIAIQIAEDRAADESSFCERGGVGCVEFQDAAVIAKKLRARRLGIASGDQPPTGEHVEIAVAIHVRDGDRSRHGCGGADGLQRGHRGCAGRCGIEFDFHQRRDIRGGIAVVRLACQQRDFTRTRRP